MTSDALPASHVDAVPVKSIDYGVVVPTGNSRVWAAAVILFAGLALILLGGCFMIGILASMGGAFNTSSWTIGHYLFVGTLYVLAFLCFAAATMLIVSAWT